MPSQPLSTGSPPNLNLRRRPLHGLMALALLAPLRPLLAVLRPPSPQHAPPDAPVAVFASYMVGDLYMALPALKKLASERPTIVFCRPDCVRLLAREGLETIPFDNVFLTRRTPGGLSRTWGNAWALRRLPTAPGCVATIGFDLDASPLSALWMRLAGIPRVISYRRDFGVLFDETFALPPRAVHQADRDMAVVDYALSRVGRRTSDVDGKYRLATEGEGSTNTVSPPKNPTTPPPVSSSSSDVRRSTSDGLKAPSLSSHPSPWLLSVWTRKPSKNWPLEKWDELLEGLVGQGVACAVLRAPDGDEDYRRFCARWDGRVGFVSGSLDQIADAVRSAAGVVATDNFLGHMAGYHGKPVVWINMVSPAAQVLPRGPRTIEVAPAGHAEDAVEVTVDAVRRAFDRARSATGG